MSAPSPETDTSDAPPPSGPTRPAMCAAASWFLNQTTLPRHQTVKLFGEDFSAFLEQLIPQIEQLARRCAEDDTQALVALAGAAEARRRLGVAERPGLSGEVERVKRLARSVVALHDHYGALTDTRRRPRP
ncbi:DUF6415 family natural product biosynthesis protein [Streptomyces sp. NY05-11A]|uniref:DUF6415 family natural product biosynthesis protein n=1 Tax=Streptomyces soliscabiei TaxID=588897 RepID=UPI0029B85397|nr:DUF6415 family natural product biosynthesis protein [Streptomyces sp. NY05-11A]MDX2677345.1 DUF6415 family natural product biosynthesis protein [Streptomyces sp. NY05-11A]